MKPDGSKTEVTLIPVEQDTISFYGHELIAVRLEDGSIAAVLRWLCDSLNLHPHAQLQRITRKTVLRQGLIRVRINTAGGPQEMPALTLKVLPGWLFTIDENRIKPEAREDLILFQAECVDVLAEHFAHKHGVTQAASQSLAVTEPHIVAEMAEIRGQIATLTGVTNLLQEHLASLLTVRGQVAELGGQVAELGGELSEQMSVAIGMLEDLARRQNLLGERPRGLTPAHARAVLEQIDLMVHETRHRPLPLTYTMIYARLAQTFNVGSYREIPDERYEEILNFLINELHKVVHSNEKS